MSDQQATNAKGEVRVRSNICTDPNEIHLVPWALARTHWPERTPTSRQKEEAAYLVPCTLCKRRLFEINEYGCDHHVCRRQGTSSVSEAAQLRGSRDGGVAS